MTIGRADSSSPAVTGNFRRNKSGPKYTSSSRRKSHLSPARSNRGASLPSSLSVCWYDRRESLSIRVSAVLFFVELESTGGIISLLFSVEIGDNLQRLPVIMTMNSVVPAFPNYELCARWPPFGRKTSVRDLPMMSFIGDRQRQSPLLTPLAKVGLLFQVRAQTAGMPRPEVLASAVRNNTASAGRYNVRDRSFSTHSRKTPVEVS